MSRRIIPDGCDPLTTFEGSGYRLEPLGPAHNERDHAAWMGSIDHIRATRGFPMADGWPYPMSAEANLADLEAHLGEFVRGEAFAFSVLDGDAVVGCVYLTSDPGTPNGVRLRSWVTADHAHLDDTLRTETADWVATTWPFASVAVVGG